MFEVLNAVIFLKILRMTMSEAPSSFYSRPTQQPLTPTLPQDSYGPPPAIPSTSYGVPQEPLPLYRGPTKSSAYGPPTQATAYGPPAAETPAPIIHKHVYVHIAPPEPEYTTPRRPLEVLPAQKHYRIIFIKAPTQTAPTLPSLPPVVENEEKTIVYVLVKRPDEAPEIVIPTPASTVPSKPEVYFIRYKTQEASTPAPGTVSESGGYYRK